MTKQEIIKISYTIIILRQVGWDSNADLWKDVWINTIPKQFNFELDPNIDKIKKS